MLIYFHGGDLPSWMIDLIFLLFALAPFAAVSLPFLFFYFYFKWKKNKSNDDEKLSITK
jgi:hypothetical protein